MSLRASTAWFLRCNGAGGDEVHRRGPRTTTGAQAADLLKDLTERLLPVPDSRALKTPGLRRRHPRRRCRRSAGDRPHRSRRHEDLEPLDEARAVSGRIGHGRSSGHFCAHRQAVTAFSDLRAPNQRPGERRSSLR